MSSVGILGGFNRHGKTWVGYLVNRIVKKMEKGSTKYYNLGTFVYSHFHDAYLPRNYPSLDIIGELREFQAKSPSICPESR